MNQKELKCFGMALDALLEHGLIDEVKKIVKEMAEKDQDEKKSDEK